MNSLIKTYSEVWEKSQKNGGERNFFDYFIYRRISTLFLCFIKEYNFSPNLITTFSIIFSFISGILFILQTWGTLYYLAIVFMMMSLVADTMDGQYARLKGKSSEFGGWYDAISDSLKYVILFISLSIGSYLNNSITNQWLLGKYPLFTDYPEILLILGLLIISNFYLIYHIHGTRYQLSFNPGTMVNIFRGDSRYHFGIESTLYTLFLVFLLVQQVYWLFILLVIALPFAWIYPFYRTYKHYRFEVFEK